MMLRLLLALLVVAIAGGAALVFTQGGRTWLKGIKAEWEVRRLAATLEGVSRRAGVAVPMADGTRLMADIYLPDGGEPKATILVRTPYGRTRNGEARHWVRLFAARGYAVMIQDVRGRWGSQGTFAPWPNAGPDGADTLDWIVAQPWSDGTVGTIGCSAMGEVQLPLAALRHPAHRAMIALGSGGAAGELDNLWNAFGMFEGGIYTLAPAFGWFTQAGGKTADRMAPVAIDHAEGLATLPLIDAVRRYRADPTDHEALLEGFGEPGWAKKWGYLDGSEQFSTPALLGDTWFDHSVHATLAMRGLIARSAPASAIIAPGTHCDFTGPFRSGSVGDYAVAPDPDHDPDSLFLAFMDHHLRGGPAPDLPQVRAYELGADVWQNFSRWPPEGAAAHALPLDGETFGLPAARTGRRQILSDPADPVPSIGGALCCTGNPDDRAGPLDQRLLERRSDVLVYTSPPLARPLRLAGPLTARLSVAVDAKDADLVVRLTEVFPDGRSILVQEGSLRLRYRSGFTSTEPLEPGVPVSVTIPIRDTLRTIPAGHRLRLHIAGSSFPRLARNMQGGGVTYLETEPQPAEIAVLSGPGQPSALEITSFGPPVFLGAERP